MANQEITFDTSDGINLTGWWSNPSTGEAYKIVDQFFQDNSLYVKTEQGQIINFNRIQNFVRSDQPLTYPISQQTDFTPPGGNSKLLDGLQEEVPEGMLPEDLELIRGRRDGQPNTQKVPEKSVNYMILEKMFSKAPDPQVHITLEWNWPKLEGTLETLTETMEVSKEEISQFICDKYCSNAKELVQKELERLLNPELSERV